MSVHAGLCTDCVHRRIVRSRRGSSFLLCGLSRTDPRFARYPRLPVLSCDGFRSAGAEGTSDGDTISFLEEHD